MSYSHDALMRMTEKNREAVKAMERIIGHGIPPPYSDVMLADLHVMPRSAKLRGEGEQLMALSKQLYEGTGS